MINDELRDDLELALGNLGATICSMHIVADAAQRHREAWVRLIVPYDVASGPSMRRTVEDVENELTECRARLAGVTRRRVRDQEEFFDELRRMEDVMSAFCEPG